MPLPSPRACTAKRISAEALERRVPCRWKPDLLPFRVFPAMSENREKAIYVG